jgi:hypothetical protein
MDWDAINAALAALGLKLVNVVAGAITSFAALRFFDGLKLWEKWLTFLGGWGLAAFGSPPITEFFELKPKVEVGIALLAGLFGMAIAAAVMKLIKETDWVNLVRSLFDAVIRRRPNGGS